MKAMVNWLLILQSAHERSFSQIDASSLKISTVYISGMMLTHIPQAGGCLGYVDIAFWAVFLYLLGSIVYTIDSFYLWPALYPAYSDDSLNPSNVLNTLAAALFVINAIVCILDWWLQIKQLSIMNLLVDESMTGGLQVSEIPKISMFYFRNNFFFMGAAVV